MKPRRVVVTGLGALTPIGNTLSEYWEGLIAGTSGADKITYLILNYLKHNLLVNSRILTL